MNAETAAPARPRSLTRWPTYCLAQLYRPANARIEVALAETGVSLRTYHILAWLDRGEGLSQQQVADRIEVDRSDMVRALDRLEEQGYVVRVRDTADRRRHVLTITPAGRTAMKEAEPIIGRLNDEMLRRLSDEERRTFHRLILRAIGESTDVVDQPAPSEEQV
jgi:MarR family transcriptional regulator, lower aerobic nicotinate degradation pathway regulator